jgi:hypothetical protein
VSSAEDVFGAVIAPEVSAIEMNLSESECCRNKALERHPEALHIGRCGGVQDVSNIRLVASAVNDDQASTIAQLPTQAERRRCQRPQAVRDARSERSGER